MALHTYATLEPHPTPLASIRWCGKFFPYCRDRRGIIVCIEFQGFCPPFVGIESRHPIPHKRVYLPSPLGSYRGGATLACGVGGWWTQFRRGDCPPSPYSLHHALDYTFSPHPSSQHGQRYLPVNSLIKKKRKFSDGMAKSYMRNSFLMYEEVREYCI